MGSPGAVPFCSFLPHSAFRLSFEHTSAFRLPFLTHSSVLCHNIYLPSPSHHMHLSPTTCTPDALFHHITSGRAGGQLDFFFIEHMSPFPSSHLIGPLPSHLFISFLAAVITFGRGRAANEISFLPAMYTWVFLTPHATFVRHLPCYTGHLGTARTNFGEKDKQTK